MSARAVSRRGPRPCSTASPVGRRLSPIPTFAQAIDSAEAADGFLDHPADTVRRRVRGAHDPPSPSRSTIGASRRRSPPHVREATASPSGGERGDRGPFDRRIRPRSPLSAPTRESAGELGPRPASFSRFSRDRSRPSLPAAAMSTRAESRPRTVQSAIPSRLTGRPRPYDRSSGAIVRPSSAPTCRCKGALRFRVRRSRGMCSCPPVPRAH